MEPVSLITFRVADQNLAIPIDQVREVIRNVKISPAASWTGLMHGIINLRGTVVPILDLRLLLGEKNSISSEEEKRKLRIIVVEMLDRVAGLVVDQVEDIVPLTREQLVPISMISPEIKSALLIGVAKIEDRLYLVLDIAQLIHEEERNLFKEVCMRLNKEKLEGNNDEPISNANKDKNVK